MYILSQEAFVHGTIAGEFVLLEFTGHNLQWHALAVHGQEVESRTVRMGPVTFLCCNVSPASPPPTSIGIWTQTIQSHKNQNTWRTFESSRKAATQCSPTHCRPCWWGSLLGIGRVGASIHPRCIRWPEPWRLWDQGLLTLPAIHKVL